MNAARLLPINAAKRHLLNLSGHLADAENCEPEGMRLIRGGTFHMGSESFYPEEAPVRNASVKTFWIDIHPVTNKDFSKFVDDTGYKTVAEKPAYLQLPNAVVDIEPGSTVFVQPDSADVIVEPLSWWRWVAGASWRHPYGPQSSIKGLEQHPVVHIAWQDCLAYATWAGKELPTEAEWEFAARGGLQGATYCWGDDFAPGGQIMANIWTGHFPTHRKESAEFQFTSSVGSFPANGYGVYDMSGNVWEWTCSWYEEPNRTSRSCCSSIHEGPSLSGPVADRYAESNCHQKVLKGGSFLCAPNYCLRYRPSARIPQAIDTPTCHQGFRCVRRIS